MQTKKKKRLDPRTEAVLRKRFLATFLLGWMCIAFICVSIAVIFAKPVQLTPLVTPAAVSR